MSTDLIIQLKVDSEPWFQDLNHRQVQVRSFFPAPHPLSVEEHEWTLGGAVPAIGGSPTWADVMGSCVVAQRARILLWPAPVWEAGIDGTAFMPGLPRHHVRFS